MNELNNEHDSNLLRYWRLRAGLRAEAVDLSLSLENGTTVKYEALGILRVPGCELVKLIEYYNVPTAEFCHAVNCSVAKIIKK